MKHFNLTGGYLTLSFSFFLIINLLLYIVLIGVYARLSDAPMFFPASCVLAIALPLFDFLFLKKIIKENFDGFMIFLMSFCVSLSIIVFAVFAPTFFDRSISYHMAFYATEAGSLKKSEIETIYAKRIFEKRFSDAERSGFITSDDGENFYPTTKAKIFTAISLCLGKATNSLQEYEDMKKELQSNES